MVDASTFINLAMVLGLVQLSKKIDFENAETLNLMRIGFFTSQLLFLALCFYLKQRIAAKNETAIVTIPKAGSDETEEITAKEHDLRQAQKLLQATLMSLGMISLLHFQFKFTHPLFLQMFLPWKNLLNNVFKVHLFGKEATGDLARPWIEKNPFQEFTAQQQQPVASTETTQTVVSEKKNKSRKED